jgi:hypothetical protein
MPLQNNPNYEWNGHLIENFAGNAQPLFTNLQTVLANRNLPQVTAKPARVNMWWRADSPCLDITSSIDGSVMCPIHTMDYGMSMFIGVASAPVSGLGNYYKRMAAAAFLETVDRCMNEAITATATRAQQAQPQLKEIGKAGKFGG